MTDSICLWTNGNGIYVCYSLFHKFYWNKRVFLIFCNTNTILFSLNKAVFYKFTNNKAKGYAHLAIEMGLI